MSTTTHTRASARALLACGMVAGPLYFAVYVVQALARDGVDVTRHAGSLLTNGDAGWIQMANFVVTGVLLVAGAVGVRRALPAGPSRVWGPRLLGVFGASFVAAGIFRADPGFGFPPGTPEGPGALSSHGLVHFAAGGIGFLCLVACCLVFARRFARLGERGWAMFSAVTGVLFLAAFAGIASGSGGAGVTVPFVGASILAFAWIASLSAHLRKDAV